MEKLHETTKSIMGLIDSREPLNLIELNDIRVMKYLCSNIHNLVILFNKDLLTDDIIIKPEDVPTSIVFELREPIIKKYMEVTNMEKGRLERLMKECRENTINEFNTLLNEYRKIMGIHNYKSISPIISKGEHKITISNGKQIEFIIIPEKTYSMLRLIDKLSNVFERYMGDRIVEEEYERLNQK